jgi:quercetin dioxygenase-like cupin family protein
MTQNIAGEPDTTSGSATRDPRTLRQPLMRFNLLDEIGRLAGEPQWNDGDRNSIVLAKDARFRMLLTVLRSGARMSDDDGEATLSIHLITGSATAARGRDSVVLAPGEIAVLEAGSRWSLEANEESAALLTFSWPEELARV